MGILTTLSYLYPVPWMNHFLLRFSSFFLPTICIYHWPCGLSYLIGVLVAHIVRFCRMSMYYRVHLPHCKLIKIYSYIWYLDAWLFFNATVVHTHRHMCIYQRIGPDQTICVSSSLLPKTRERGLRLQSHSSQIKYWILPDNNCADVSHSHFGVGIWFSSFSKLIKMSQKGNCKFWQSLRDRWEFLSVSHILRVWNWLRSVRLIWN